MDVDSQLYKIVEGRKEDLAQCHQELKALKDEQRKKKVSKLKKKQPPKPNVDEAPKKRLPKPKVDEASKKRPPKPNVDEAPPKKRPLKPNVNEATKNHPSKPNVDESNKARPSSKVTFNDVGFDDDVDANEENKEHTVHLLDTSSEEDDSKRNSPKRQRHKTAILDPSHSSPTKVQRPLCLGDAQLELASLSRSAGLQECHTLEFFNQKRQPRPKNERFARLPALVILFKLGEEMLDADEMFLDWCDYKLFNHFHGYLHEPMSEHSFPMLWEKLIHGCVLNADFDPSGFPLAIQNAFGVWGTPEQGTNTYSAVQCLAHVLKQVSIQKCKHYSSESAKLDVSSLKATWIQMIATFFRSQMVDFHYLEPDEISDVAMSYVQHNHKIPKSKDSCTLTQYILWSQYKKVKAWHTSPVMRKLYHDIENFPDTSLGKETSTENSTSQLITFALEHIFNDAFANWPAINSEFQQQDMEGIAIHEFFDSPDVPKDYLKMKNNAPKRNTKRRSSTVKPPPPKKKVKSTNDYADVGDKKDKTVSGKGSKYANVGHKKDKKVSSKGSSVIGLETICAVKEVKLSNVMDSKIKSTKDKKPSNVTKKCTPKKSELKPPLLKPPSEIYSNFFHNFTSRGIENAAYCRNITFLPDNEQSPSAELKLRFQKALKAPELGCVLVDFAGNVQLLTTDNLVKKHAREHLDGIGKESRKEQSGNEHPMKEFLGHEVPNNKCAAYLVHPPKRLSDCYTRAYHLYAAQVDDPDTKRVTQGIVLNIEDPILQCHTCAKHPKGCGRTLKVGDVVKIDGSTPATLITGRAWMFNVIRFNGDDIDRKCGVGVLKCFATQPHIVANRVAIVTEIGEHEPTDKPHISTVAQKCKYAMIAFLDGNTIVSSSATAQDLTDTHSDSSDDDSDSD